MADFTPEVTQWLQLTSDLISAASDYAATGRDDENLNAMMRAIQVKAAALNASMMAVQQAGLGQAPQRPFNVVTTPMPAAQSAKK